MLGHGLNILLQTFSERTWLSQMRLWPLWQCSWIQLGLIEMYSTNGSTTCRLSGSFYVTKPHAVMLDATNKKFDKTLKATSNEFSTSWLLNHSVLQSLFGKVLAGKLQEWCNHYLAGQWWHCRCVLAPDCGFFPNPSIILNFLWY